MEPEPSRTEEEEFPSNTTAKFDPTLVKLVDRADSSFSRVRKRAQEALLERGEEGLLALLALFEQERARHHRRKRLYTSTVVTLLVFSIIFSFSTLTGFFETIGATTFGMLVLMAIGCLILCGVFSVVKMLAHRHERVVKALLLFEDVRIVGPLAEALEFERKEETGFLSIYRAAIVALVRLLPRLTCEDAQRLNGPQIGCLCRAIATNSAEFALGVIHVLEYVGDSSALPYVERLTHSAAMQRFGPDVYEAAQRCLPILQERAAQEQARQTLLRGAKIPEPTGEVLLRPATAVETEDPRQLLRAGTEGSEPR